MQGDLGKSQLSSLLETVPGLAGVLRSPVADAIVNMVLAGAGLRDFDYHEAEELIQYATRRGLIPTAEGASLLEEIKVASRKNRSKTKASKKTTAKKTVEPKGAAKKAAPKKATAKKAVSKKAVAKKVTPKKAVAKKTAAKKSKAKKTVKKTPKKATKKRR